MTDAPRPPGRALATSLWRRLCRFNFTRSRLSRRALAHFCSRYQSLERTLVVHSGDVDFRRFFPNCFVVTKNPDTPADLHADAYYTQLAELPDNSFPIILCTGLLEHIPDPERLVAQLGRIAQPGGRLLLSASAVFPFHGGPDNFYHFTGYGLRHLFREWSRFEELQGSSRPFETIAILLQRINLQCDIFPPIRLLIELLWRVAPLLDVFVLRQYDNHWARQDGAEAESFMPAMMLAVVIR